MLFAGNLNHAFMDHTLVSRIHTLIDFVDHTEGGSGEGLQRHEVEDCGDGAFATRLAVGVENLKSFILSVYMLVHSSFADLKKLLNYLNLTLISIAQRSKSSSL